MQKLSISNKRYSLPGTLVLGMVLLSSHAAGSAPVVDAQPSIDRENRPALVPPPRQQQRAVDTGDDQPVTTAPFRAPVLEDDDEGDPASVGSMVLQLQQLQQEVMTLRGMVEAQQHAIARLEREQRERYLDLDRRLSRAGAGAGAAGGGPLLLPEGPDDDMPATPAAADDERAAYEHAFRLTRDREFEAAVAAFRDFLEEYSGGDFEGNAWYWLGELYLVIEDPDLEASREAFVQVKERWPDHNKVPDVLYKLGVVYHQLGEPGQAREHLETVREEYPDSSAARLAGSYLERL